MWLHNLYLRHTRTGRSNVHEKEAMLWCGPDCNLWMTDVTFQGSGNLDPSSGALEVSGGQMYAQGTQYCTARYQQIERCMIFGYNI